MGKLLHLLPIAPAHSNATQGGFECPCCCNSFEFPIATASASHGACPYCFIEHTFVAWGLHSVYPGSRQVSRLILAMLQDPNA